MSANTVEIARLAAAVERQRAVQDAAKEAAAALRKLTLRRNLYWIAAGACFLTAGLLTAGLWAHKFSLPIGLISWLGPGLTTFSILGGIGTQKTINKHEVMSRIEAVEEKLSANIRDHAPADAIELARIATMVERVSATQSKIVEAQAKAVEEMRALRAMVELVIVKADAVAFVDARSEAEDGRTEGVATVTQLPVNGRSPLPRKGDHS